MKTKITRDAVRAALGARLTQPGDIEYRLMAVHWDELVQRFQDLHPAYAARGMTKLSKMTEPRRDDDVG